MRREPPGPRAPAEAMLSPWRVLDLSDERGLLCGRILTGLGADVIMVEPPGGSSARRVPPLLDGVPVLEQSLYWAAYGEGRRGVELDLDAPEGRGTLLRLAASADMLIESADPGVMAARGLGPDDLAEVNPALVYVSITPFGQDGPKAGYLATDLILAAASGTLHIAGYPDAAPVRVSAPQAYLHGGAEAAGAALVALAERVRSGRGQHVDVSIQQAMNLGAMGQTVNAAAGAPETTRVAGGAVIGPVTLKLIWEAKDGYVSLTFFFGGAVGPFTRRLMEWICEEGGCDEATRDKDWIAYAALLQRGEEPYSEFDRVVGLVEDFLRTKTKDELMLEAQRRRLLILPVATIPETIENPQLSARRYWRSIYVSRRHAMEPGPPVLLSAQPPWPEFPTPRLGQHNDDVLAEPLRPSPPPPDPASASGLPFEGLCVLDFMWVMAGPVVTRVLADYGATVIRVESPSRPGAGRSMAPFRGGQFAPQNSLFFDNMNAGKLGLALNLSCEEGREVARDLVRWADVVGESFAPRAFRRWGLDYDSLRAIKPDLIMLSSSLFGQDGPLSDISGFGTMGAAVSAFIELTGYPDRPPAGPFSAYTDTVAPRFALAGLLAALDHRRRTGEGQYIDHSQIESSLHFLTPYLLDYQMTARVLTRMGNRDSYMAPHGVYPSRGDDDWVAIAVRDDADWGRLCDVIERPDLARDARYDNLAGRLTAQDELDEAVSVWTRTRAPAEAEAVLQAAGVPAHAVIRASSAVDDPQFTHRGHFVRVPHSLHGESVVEGSRFRLSRTPARIGAPPAVGEHTEQILREFLGYDDERIAALAAAGAFD